MGAPNLQESVTFLQHSFSMLQCGFSLVAAQLLVEMRSALQKSECCSATLAAQLSEKCSATSVFACGMLQECHILLGGGGARPEKVPSNRLDLDPETPKVSGQAQSPGRPEGIFGERGSCHEEP